MHQFLNKLNLNDYIDCIYLIGYHFNTGYKDKISRNTNKPFIMFNVTDASDVKAYVSYFKKEGEDISYLSQEFKYKPYNYIHIKGRVTGFDSYGGPFIWADSITPISSDTSDMIFDRANLYKNDLYYANKATSIEGLINVRLVHTSNEDFQENFDMLEIGDTLSYERIYDSPHDKNQIDVYSDDLNERLSIPSYLTACLAPLIDDGYELKITVSQISLNDEAINQHAGLKVNIKAVKL